MTSQKYWSTEVTKTSNAMTLQKGVFTLNNPKQIAKSLCQSAQKSSRIKSTPFRSAMSMLNFYINRAGKNLSTERLKILNQAKEELRKICK